MRKIKILFFALILILAVNISYPFQTNSTNYKNFPLIVSSGGEIVNSTNYKTYTATGIVAGITNSTIYKNLLGFFYAWLLADGEACTADNQCEGGFCCSNVCKSSACPAEEEEEGAAAAAGGGGGGGGGGYGDINVSAARFVKKEKDLTVSKGIVRTKIALAEFDEDTLSFSNTGKTLLEVSLLLEGVDEFLTLSDDRFVLGVDESADITLSFIGKRVGSWPGQIIAIAEGIERVIPVIVEIVSDKVLFDVKLDIPTTFATVNPGGALKSQITLLNVGAPEKVDVFITYFIKDLRGNIVYEETETFAVEKQLSYPKLFSIPKEIDFGSYVAIIEVRYADSFAVSSQLFSIAESKGVVQDIIIRDRSLIMVVTFILIGILLLVLYKLFPKKRKNK